MHTDASAMEYVPWGQLVHAVDKTTEYVPALQPKQVDDAGAEMMVPAAQFVQLDDEATE